MTLEMLVYFTASIVGKKRFLKNYLHILSCFQSKNFDVLADHILKTTEQEIRFEKKEERLRFHSRLEKWIRSCDMMVVEASFPSISVGYEISMALQLHKPILILYCEGDPPSLLVHHSDEKVVCEKYTHSTLCGIVDDFVNYAQGAVDSRFTFFITPAIVSYLEKVSKKSRLPKSVYLRRLIEKDMALHASP